MRKKPASLSCPLREGISISPNLLLKGILTSAFVPILARETNNEEKLGALFELFCQTY